MTKYAIVPVEPTPEMDLACTNLAVQRFRDWPTNGELYRAMLASAPPSDLIAVPQRVLGILKEMESRVGGRLVGYLCPTQKQQDELRALLSPTATEPQS